MTTKLSLCSCPYPSVYALLEDGLTISVIIPTLNEAARISETISEIRAICHAAEILVADGGSDDDTCSLAERAGATIIHCQKGRGIQCNRGAEQATGTLLLFQHADCRLPKNASAIIRKAFRCEDIKLGTFRLQFDSAERSLRFFAFFSRFDSIFTRFGDQVITIRKEVFTELDGFPEWPIFEDVHFLRKARKRHRIHSFAAQVVTSARRFKRVGIWRTQILNFIFITQYLLGVSPKAIDARYRRALRPREDAHS